MAELNRKDWVKDQTQTTGLGAYTLDGVAPSGGFVTYAASLTNGKRYRSVVYQSSSGTIEVVEGVWTSGTNSFSRDALIWSSTGAFVNWGAGIKEMWVGPTDRDFEVPDFATGAPIASAATVNLDTATGGRVHVTGTTTITGITLTRGPRTVIFDGSLTLTHNATTLNLPGAKNIVTQAGDIAEFQSDGTSVYCVNYQRASGVPVAKGMVLLATIVPTAGASSVDFLNAFSSDYDNYLIVGDNLEPSLGSQFLMHFASGGVVDTTSSYYAPGTAFTNTTSTLANPGVTGGAVATGAGGLCFRMNVLNVNDASANVKLAYTLCGYATTSAGFTAGSTSVLYPKANTVSGISFAWSGSATFAGTGSIRVYGLSNV